MPERIVSILGRLRTRLVVVRSAEAAAVGGTAGGVIAAFLMAGRILAGLHPAAAAVLSAAPLAGAVVLIASGRLRKRVSSHPLLQWYVVALSGVAGAVAVAWTLSGAFAHVPKNWLFGVVPCAALLAAGVVSARGASLWDAALATDRLAELKERLSTALELCEIGRDLTFAQAVHTQASAAGAGLRGVPFWDRTRATLGALVLAVLGPALMLPWDVLISPTARRQRQWRQLAPAAAEALRQSLAGLDLGAADDAAVAEKLRRLETLAGALQAARPEEATRWRGKVIELDRLSEGLRRAVESGQVEAATAERLWRVIAAIEQAVGELAEGMSQAEGALAAVQPPPVPPPPATAKSAPAGWAHVFNPEYAEFAKAGPTDTAPARQAQTPPISVPFDRQWNQARRRAAQALQRQTIPPEYRQLMRDFFAAE